MKLFIISISIFFSCFFSLNSFAQSCGSGGGAQVCLSAEGTASSINLSWTVSGSISSVQIYRDTDSNPVGRIRIATVNSNTRTYTDSTAVVGTQYWYWIKFRAANQNYNSGAATASILSSCSSTPITPHISIDGSWSQTAAVTVNSGATVTFGPQPSSGGSWSWSGCGTSGSSREQVVNPTATCTAQAVHTNSCGATSTQNFTITVNSSSLYPSYNTNPVAADMTGMSSNAAQLASKIKLGVNIGNTMEAYGCKPPSETCWGQPMVSTAYIKLLKDSGFDAVRIPVSWDQYANQETAEISAAWLDRVKQVVQWSVDNGLYVVVNIHWDGGWLEKNFSEATKAAVNAKQKAYWEQIATKLRDFDEHVLFASANEPDAETAADIAVLESYHQTFVDAVRSTGGKNAYRVLVLQAPKTNIDKAATEWNNMPSDSATGRQMAEVHFYPFNFTIMSKDETWGKMTYYWGKDYHSTTDPERNATWGEEDYVNSQFASMKAKFADRGIPVVLGEFAAMLRTQLTGDDAILHRASRAYFHEYVTRKALENGILPFVWEVGSDPGLLFNRSIPAVGDQQFLDALLIGAGKKVGSSSSSSSSSSAASNVITLNTSPGNWSVVGATKNESATNIEFTLSAAGQSAQVNFSTPINMNGASIEVVLNVDQAFVTNRNGGNDGILQFYALDNDWGDVGGEQWVCWTGFTPLVANQDKTFTCSGQFTNVPDVTSVGLQFLATAGTVTIKSAAITLAE